MYEHPINFWLLILKIDTAAYYTDLSVVAGSSSGRGLKLTISKAVLKKASLSQHKSSISTSSSQPLSTTLFVGPAGDTGGGGGAAAAGAGGGRGGRRGSRGSRRGKVCVQYK